MNLPRKLGCFCGLLILLNCTLGAPLLAQEGDAVILGEQQRVPLMGLDNVSTELELLFRTQIDEVSGGGSPTQRTTEHRFRQNLNVAGHSWFVHPNLLDINFAGSFGVSEQLLETNDSSTTNIGIIDEYDVSAVLVREGPAPTTFYSQRVQELVSRQFSGTLENTLTIHGASVDFRWDVLPTHLNVYRSEQKQTDAGSIYDFERDQDTFEWHSENRGDDGRLTWDYRFNDVRQKSSSAEDEFRNHDGVLSHIWEFGPGNRYNLNSTAGVFKQSGSGAITRARWDESLYLRHTPEFQTNYQYSLNYQDQENLTQTVNRGRAGFRHRLYDSLVTSGNVGGASISQSPSGDGQQWFGNLDTAYRKKVPHGLFSGDLGGSVNVQRNEERGGEVLLLDVPRTFVDPDPVLLTDRGIITASIVITDLTGLIIFNENLDYTVVTFADRVEIYRVVGGGINDGDSVLIDYRLGPEAQNSTTTLALRTGVRYSIEEGPLQGLGMFIRYFHQEQDVDSDDPFATFVVNEIDDVVMGLDYRIWKLTLLGEYQIHDSTINPYQALRLTGRLSHRIDSRSTAGLVANHTILDYEEGDRKSVLTSVQGRVQQEFTRNLFGTLTAAWRLQDSTLIGASEAWDVTADLTWRYRQTEVFTLVRSVILETGDRENLNLLFQMGIRRKF